MPWVTIFYQDTGELHGIGWPSVQTPYGGEVFFGRVETAGKPDPTHWDPATRTYHDKVVDEKRTMATVGGKRSDLPVDPIEAQIKAEVEAKRLYEARVAAGLITPDLSLTV